MDIKTIDEELKGYLDKWSRFLSKDVYISSNMYDKFVEKYKYLYIECDTHIDKVKDNINYLKIKKIKSRKIKFIREHNKKYLINHLSLDKEYFDNMYDRVSLSNKDREIMLVEDNLVVNNKNNYQKIILILSKVRYLMDKKKYKDKDINIILGNDEDYKDLSKLLNDYKIKTNIYLYTDILKEYCNKNKLINYKDKYQILENYFKREIFSNKRLLREYITNFKYLYFNRDVYEYDTLNDYHNYMFMRKYIESGNSKKDYLNSLIDRKRRNYTSINNDKLRYKEEVDIANYLYLHNIRYKIINKDKIYFKINDLVFYYSNSIEDDTDDKYFKLFKKYKSGTLLTHLKKLLSNNNIEEIVIDKNILKNKLKNDSKDIYYKEFIDRIVIPYIDSDNKDNKLLNNIKKYYLNYLEDNKYIDEYLLINKVSKDKKYNTKYLIMDNNYIDTESIKLIIK